MCRIFYALNQSQIKHKIMQFLRQSDQPIKNTPGINSEADHIHNVDGYGLASFHNRHWKVYKSKEVYHANPKTTSYIDEIVKVGSSLVIGHIRKKIDTAPVSLENTHPFQYGDHVFLHNGGVFEFHKKRELFAKPIHKKYKIGGETDTEYIFYLLLTYLERNSQNVEEAFQHVFSRLSKIYSKWNATIIYANATHSYIIRTKYINEKIHPGKTIDAPSLYWNGKPSNKILITSEPILKTYSIIPENSFIVVPHSHLLERKEGGQ